MKGSGSSEKLFREVGGACPGQGRAGLTSLLPGVLPDWDLKQETFYHGFEMKRQPSAKARTDSDAFKRLRTIPFKTTSLEGFSKIHHSFTQEFGNFSSRLKGR